MLGKLLRRIGVNLLLPLLIGITAAEIIGQLWLDNPLTYHAYQFRYLTPDSVRNIGGIWTFRPDTDIRQVGYFKRPFGDVFIDSDCRYVSDDAGFLDNDAKGKIYDILLLGDSFTSGVTGCSWVRQLRAQMPTVSIYSAALTGTGVENWAEELRYLTDQGYRFHHVIVIFIADDFFRPRYGWNERDLRCLHDLATCVPEDGYYPLAPGVDVAAVSRARAGRLGFWTEARHWLKRNMWVSYVVAYAAVQRLTTEASAITPATARDFDRIVAAAGSIELVKIDQKDEVALHAPNGETIASDRFLAGRHRSYDRCTLRYDEFDRYDTHPVRAGYAHLARCVAAVARRLEPDKAAAAKGP